MAWNVRWQVQFRSLKGVNYTVNISEQGWTGGVTQLTPSDQPFTTQEDDDDDVFKPIRAQSGYLRVIDATGNLLESLMPENNTQRLVQLMVGTAVRWQGFLQADAYTQPWLEGKVEIELPLKSVIGALEDVVINSEWAQNHIEIRKIFARAFTDLGVTPSFISVISELSYATSHFWYLDVSISLFFDKTEIHNQGTTESVMVGDSYASVLEKILALYGFQMREQGDEIFIAQYDASSVMARWRADWAWITESGGDITVLPIDEAELMQSIEFRKDDSEIGFTGGKKDAIVNLKINTEEKELLSLPITEEDSSTPFEVSILNGNNVVIQPHNPRSNNIEVFNYWLSKEIGYSVDNFLYSRYANPLSSTFTDFFDNLLIKDNSFSNNWNDARWEWILYTGAMPVRWGQKDDTGTYKLSNGLLLVQEAARSTNDADFSMRDMYSLRSSISLDLPIGYINIDFKQHIFYTQNRDGNYADFEALKLTMYQPMKLKVGNKYWNGSEWTNTESIFRIEFEGGIVKTNKTEEIDAEEKTGWFIPITSAMVGTVELIFLNSERDVSFGYQDQTINKIITDLKVKFIYPYSELASERDENTYRQNITNNGFREEKKIELSIGTINNNMESDSFIRRTTSGGSDYITEIPFTADRIYQRPELHLLDRMVAQYQRVRCHLIAGIQTDLEVMRTVYDKDGKRYFGINAAINYRDDTASMKFIEVNKP